MSSDPESEYKKLLKTVITVSVAALIILTSTNPATPVVLKDTTEAMKNVTIKGPHTPLNVQMNSTTIIVEGAICSSGMKYDSYSRHGRTEFDNYCPFCEQNNVLIYHTGSYKGTKIDEAELSCKSCGADFCCCPCGFEKSGGFRAKLREI